MKPTGLNSGHGNGGGGKGKGQGGGRGDPAVGSERIDTIEATLKSVLEVVQKPSIIQLNSSRNSNNNLSQWLTQN